MKTQVDVTPDYESILKTLGGSITSLHRLGYKQARGTLRGTYTEIYVANRLKRFGAQVGANRAVKLSDVYLPLHPNKVSIEVKATGEPMGDATFEWSFSKKEGKQMPFDFAILFGFSEEDPLTPARTFVVAKAELPTLKNSEFYTKYGISYWRNPKDAKKPQDKLISNFPERFESKWDKITDR